jgi:hypothetical protein
MAKHSTLPLSICHSAILDVPLKGNYQPDQESRIPYQCLVNVCGDIIDIVFSILSILQPLYKNFVEFRIGTLKKRY